MEVVIGARDRVGRMMVGMTYVLDASVDVAEKFAENSLHPESLSLSKPLSLLGGLFNPAVVVLLLSLPKL